MAWVGRDLKYHLVPTSSIHGVRKELNAVEGKKIKNTFHFYSQCVMHEFTAFCESIIFFSKENSESLFLPACGGLGPGRPLGGMSCRAGNPVLPLSGRNAAPCSTGSVWTLQLPCRVLSLCLSGMIARGGCKETLPPDLWID